ncbi:TPM domain-containing protein [Pseudodonghicola flavimaris]|uniref:TPM domain-containing protein n=1 Tax=Pseudodonghicola flavimaris TaxID=3050036 RepID=A0ABT7F0I9_9RHOB|nr:TPM domain-containing protein [Pseudodonghicola flavimaris]MDK3018126.1 TPM domain-containing protein [Pseudodonghicola flavimaris]
MTRYDLKIAGLIAALVVVIGLALGYGAGLMLGGRGDLPGAPPETPAAFAAAPAEEGTADRLANPAGGTLPGYHDVYVNDYAGLLDPAAEQRLRDEMIELYDHTGIEMTVLTIDSLSDYHHFGPIEPFATALFNAWGIGNAGRNDGVLVLVSLFDRRMRIEIGAGYDAAWDDRMQRVIDEGFLPDFRDDRYQAGIETGVRETIFELTGRYPGTYDTGLLRQGWSWIFWQLSGLGGWLWAVVAVPLAATALALRRYLRLRPRPCSNCGSLMHRLGEAADDAHLDGGQRLEEFLKSVDYDVWACDSCGQMDIHRYRNWFSAFGACPKCGYHTLKTQTEVLVSATTSSTGKKRLTYDCRNCGYHDTELRTIPKVSKSSSGSGRSSFGGGSSSGGGASGSW